jgi:hypothetical protein
LGFRQKQISTRTCFIPAFSPYIVLAKSKNQYGQTRAAGFSGGFYGMGIIGLFDNLAAYLTRRPNCPNAQSALSSLHILSGPWAAP